MVVVNRDFLPRNAIHRAVHKAAVWCPSVCPSVHRASVLYRNEKHIFILYNEVTNV